MNCYAINYEKMKVAKIIQLLKTENDAKWQGRLLGLGDDGVTYECGPVGRWEEFIPPLDNKDCIEFPDRVADLPIAVRTKNALLKRGVTKTKQLAEKTEVELIKIDVIGKKSLREIKCVLESYNLNLGMRFA